jgi:hypothetical protein
LLKVLVWLADCYPYFPLGRRSTRVTAHLHRPACVAVWRQAFAFKPNFHTLDIAKPGNPRKTLVLRVLIELWC